MTVARAAAAAAARAVVTRGAAGRSVVLLGVAGAAVRTADTPLPAFFGFDDVSGSTAHDQSDDQYNDNVDKIHA